MRHFTPSEFLNTTFSLLSDKERQVLRHRFGLYGVASETLEFIGKNYGITRERVRQIAVGAIRKMRSDVQFLEMRERVESVLEHILKKYGGIMEEVMLIEALLAETDTLPTEIRQREAEYVNMQFILQHLMPEQFAMVNRGIYRRGWRLLAHPEHLTDKALTDLHGIVEEHRKPLPFERIFETYKEKPSYSDIREYMLKNFWTNETEESEDTRRVVYTLMHLSSKMASNILDEWGMHTWPTVRPKKINDKIYLVLRKEGTPLHFNDITERINTIAFDAKKAYVGTVHNELILDDKYVLVGRGLYALRDWGYTGGTVVQIIKSVLNEEGWRRLTRAEIMQKVLQQKQVKESTIYLALSDKSCFSKDSHGRYAMK